jgi:excisionase family DNA binding protein
MPKPRTAPAHTEPREPRWATLKAASEYAGGVPVRTLRDWIAKGLLPAYKIGPRQVQVDLNDVDALRVRIPTANGAAPAALLALSREDIGAIARELAAVQAGQAEPASGTAGGDDGAA